MGTEIDEVGAAKVETMIESVRSAGLTEAADLFSTVYFAWLHAIHSYVLGHPYVEQPDEGMTPIMGLHVVDYTLRHWGPKIPGTPALDDDAVRRAADADEEWHRQEDRRMRRDAGECIF